MAARWPSGPYGPGPGPTARRRSRARCRGFRLRRVPLALPEAEACRRGRLPWSTRASAGRRACPAPSSPAGRSARTPREQSTRRAWRLSSWPLLTERLGPRLRRSADDAVDANCMLLALQSHVAHPLRLEPVTDVAQGRFADQDPTRGLVGVRREERLVEALQAGGRVYRVPDDHVFRSLGAAQRPRHDRSGEDADPHARERPPLLAPAAIQIAQRELHRQRAVHR